MKMILVFFTCYLPLLHAVHLGEVRNIDPSPVGALVKIERSDFKYIDYFNSYPSIKVSCSLVRIAKDIAITNNHCVYPFIDDNGKWDLYKGFELFVSFSPKLVKTTSKDEIVLHKIKNVLHQYDVSNNKNKEFWDRLMSGLSGSTWNEILNKFIPSDMALIQFEVNSEEQNFSIAQLGLPQDYNHELPIVFSGYGPREFAPGGEPTSKNNGIKLYNDGVLVKSNPEVPDNTKISWTISNGNAGGLPTDSGGYIGTIDSETNTHVLYSLIIMNPFKTIELTDGRTQYISAVKRFENKDIDWIKESINKLYELDEGDQIKLISHPRYEF